MHNVQSPRSDDAALEQEIRAKGADVAPRVTPADIEANIASEHYFLAADGTDYVSDDRPAALELLTFCVLELRNGFTVTGESACASPENFNAEIGRKIARANAVQKIWPLMGYELRTRLHERALFDAEPKTGGSDADDFPLGKACDTSGDQPCEACQ